MRNRPTENIRRDINKVFRDMERVFDDMDKVFEDANTVLNRSDLGTRFNFRGKRFIVDSDGNVSITEINKKAPKKSLWKKTLDFFCPRYGIKP